MAKRVLTCEQDYRGEVIDALRAFDARVRTAQASAAWSAPSPCEGWTAADVVRHVTGNVRAFTVLAGADAPPDERPAGDENLIRNWERARDLADQALRASSDPAAVLVPMGSREMTIAFVIEALLRDVVIHTWDLARATGGAEVLPAHLVRAATAALARLPEPIRRRGYYADALTAPPGADEQARLLALSGRRG